MIDVLDACGRAWSGPFGLLVVQNTAFLGVLFVVLHWIRNASARVRYGVALVGLVKLVTPPFLPLSSSPVSAYTELLPAAVTPDRLLEPAASAPAGHVPSLSLVGLLFVVWAAVAAGVLAYGLVATARLRIAVRHANPADDEVSRRWSQETGVRVRVTDRVPVPMTLGLFPRTVFVPIQWNTWSSSGRRAVLRHEMAHIRRRDGLVHALEALVRSLYWFHPLVALLARRIDTCREQACDESAAPRESHGRLVYSRLLVEIAESLVRPVGARGSASTLMRRRNELFRRVHYLTQEGPVMKMSKSRAAVLTVVVAVAIASMSWYHGTAASPAPKGHSYVQMSLEPGGKIVVDGKEATLESLGGILKGSIDAKNAIVSIRCDKDVPMRTLFQMHAVLRGAGLLKVKYAGSAGRELPLILPSKELIDKTKTIPVEDIAHLAVAADGACTLDGAGIQPASVEEAVAKRLAANDKLIVSLDMAEDATYGQYVQALEKLKVAGAQRIFVSEPATP